MVVVGLWLFGNDVGGGDLVVGGVVLGRKVRRWCGVVDGCGGKGAKVVVVWLWTFGSDVGGGDLVVEGWLVQNNDRKRKTAISKGRSPVNTIIPFKQRCGNLSAHKLTGITDLRTLMVYCKFPQP